MLRSSFISHVTPLLLIIILTTAAYCDKLYVRNRPYTGATFKDARGTRVELSALLKMLDITMSQSAQGGWIIGEPPSTPTAAGVLTVNGEVVDVIERDGNLFVALEDLSKPLAFRISRNPQLGSIDVNLIKAAAGSADNNPTSAPNTGETGAHHFQNTRLGISFWAPAKYILVDNPATISKFLKAGSKIVSVPVTLVKQVSEGIQFVCVDPKVDSGKGNNDTLVMLVEHLPSTAVSRADYLAANLQGVASTFPGTIIKDKPALKNIGGLDFLSAEYLRADPDGSKRLCRFFVAVEKDKGYVIQLAAESTKGLNILEKLLDNLKCSGSRGQ